MLNALMNVRDTAAWSDDPYERLLQDIQKEKHDMFLRQFHRLFCFDL